jgi:hypothetical protein
MQKPCCDGGQVRHYPPPNSSGSLPFDPTLNGTAWPALSDGLMVRLPLPRQSPPLGDRCDGPDRNIARRYVG